MHAVLGVLGASLTGLKACRSADDARRKWSEMVPRFSFFAMFENSLQKLYVVRWRGCFSPSLLAIALTVPALILLFIGKAEIISNVRMWGSESSTVLASNDKSTSEPYRIEGMPEGANLHFRLSLQIRAESTAGHPNVFQTSGDNDGVRVEVNRNNVAVVAGNNRPYWAPIATAVSTPIETGRWYNLTIEALDQGFVSIRLDDRNTALIQDKHITFKTDDVKIGAGYDKDRAFHGDIRNVRLEASGATPYNSVLMAYWATVAVIIAVLIASLRARRSDLKRIASEISTDDINRRLATVTGILAIANIAAWTYTALEIPRRLAHVLHINANAFQTRAPLYELGAPFTDFTEIWTFPNYVSAISWASPPAEQIRIMVKQFMMVEWPATWDSGLFFVLFCGLGLGIHVFGMIRLTQACGTDRRFQTTRILLLSILVLMLYPIHFAIDRGNSAIHNTGLIILGAALYLRGSPYLAAIAFDLATISKITPIAFAVSYFRERKWKPLAFMMALAATGFIVPTIILWHLYGYNINWMLDGQKIYSDEMAVSPEIGLAYSTSLFSLIRLVVTFFEVARGFNFEEASLKAIPLISNLMPYYTIVMAAVGLDLLVQTWRKRLSPAIAMSLSAIYQVMAPPIISDYYLTLLTVPLLIFIFTPNLKRDRVVQFIIVAALVPKTFAWIPYGLSVAPYNVSIGVPVNAALITFLYVYLRIKYAARKERFQTLSTPLHPV
ncbi:glycosyltransferase 87 family protein [Rhizobium sp. A22-96]